MTTEVALRTVRIAEAVYAVIALVLAFGMPLPPRGPAVVLFSHWLGTSLLAAAVAVRLGRPNRQTWYVAALLSGYVLFNAVVAIVRLVGPASSDLGQPAMLALAIGSLLWITQAVVAAGLYQARELRTLATRRR